MSSPLKNLYLRRIGSDPAFNRLYQRSSEKMQDEALNLVDALYRGVMDDTKLGSLITANPKLANLLSRCNHNMFKSVQTAKRVMVDFDQRMSSPNAAANGTQALMESLFEDAPPTTAREQLDVERARLQMLLDPMLEEKLTQGNKTDELVAGFSGRGLEDSDTGELDPEKLKVFESQFAVDLLDAFGRFENFIQTAQKIDKEFGYGEIQDIVLGDDLDLMLDDHYIELVEPALQVVFLEQFAERQLLQVELAEDVPQASGPVAIFVDYSDSMDRLKPIAAGFALACFRYLEDQGRYVELHIYAASLRASVNSETGSLFDALEALCRPIGGGTRFGESFSAATKEWTTEQQSSNSDVIVITDGEDVYNPVPSEILGMKERGVKFSVLYIDYLTKLETTKQKLAELFDTVLLVDRTAKGDNDAQDLTDKLYSLTEQIL